MIHNNGSNGTQINGLNNAKRQQNRQTQGPNTMIQGSYQQPAPPSSSSSIPGIKQELPAPQTSRNTMASKEIFNGNNVNGDFFNEENAKITKSKAAEGYFSI
jgi:hypothetical protein